MVQGIPPLTNYVSGDNSALGVCKVGVGALLTDTTPKLYERLSSPAQVVVVPSIDHLKKNKEIVDIATGCKRSRH